MTQSHAKQHLLVRIMLSSLALLMICSVSYAQELSQAEIRASLFNSELEAQGRYDDLLTLWMQAIKQNPDSIESYMILYRMDDIQYSCNSYSDIVETALKDIDIAACKNGFNQQLLRDLEYDIKARRGQWQQAQSIAANDGTLRHWMAIGPFGYPDRSDYYFDFEFAPEKEIDFKKDYKPFPNSHRTCNWKTFHVDANNSLANPASIFEENGCIYLYCQFKSDEEQTALIKLVMNDPYKVWLNGVEIFTADSRIKDYPYVVTLKSAFSIGWNSLLIKLPQNDEFSVQLLNEQGFPLNGISTEKAALKYTIAEGKVVQAAKEVERFPMAELQAELQSTPGALFPKLALSYMHRYRNSDTCSNLAKAVLAQDSSPLMMWFYHETLEHISHMPQTSIDTEQKRYRDMILQQAPNFVPALLARANYRFANEHHKEAFADLDNVTNIAPQLAYAHYKKAAFAYRKGWIPEARKNLLTASKLSPNNTTIHQFWASYYSKLGNHERELDIYYKIRQWDQSYQIEERIAKILESMGRFDAAIKQYTSMLKVMPNSKPYQYRLAALYYKNGDIRKSLSLYKTLLYEDPDNQSLSYYIADMEYKHSIDAKSAEKSYQKLLQRNPADETLRRFLQYKNHDEEDFSLPFRYSMQNLIDNAPGNEDYPDANFITLLNQRVIRLYEDYSYSVIEHSVNKIMTKAGQDLLGEISHRGEFLEAKTYTADGKVMEPIVVSGSGLVMPGLDINASIEHRYRSFTPNYELLEFETPRFYFQDPNFEAPILIAEYVIISPPGLNIDFILQNTSIEPDVSSIGDLTVYKYKLSNLPKLTAEWSMPSIEKLLPNIQLKLKRDPETLLQFYTSYRHTLEYPTDLLQTTAKTVTADKLDIRSKAAALYNFVNHEILNEQGERKAHATLIAKSGDREILFRALAKTLDITVKTAFARPNDMFVDPILEHYPKVDDYYSSFTGIVLEDGSTLWLSFESRYQAFGTFSPFFWKAEAIVPAFFNNGQAQKIILPVGKQEELQSQSSIEVTINSNGSAAGIYKSIQPGIQGAFLKEQIIETPEDQRENMLAAELNSSLRGAAIIDYSFTDLDRYGTAYIATVNFSIQDIMQSKIDTHAELPMGMPALKLKSLTRTKERQYDMDLRRFLLHRYAKTTIHLPATMSFTTIPENKTLSLEGFSYELKIQQDGQTLVIERLFDIVPTVITKENYQKAIQFTQQVDQIDASRISITLKE